MGRLKKYQLLDTNTIEMRFRIRDVWRPGTAPPIPEEVGFTLSRRGCSIRPAREFPTCIQGEDVVVSLDELDTLSRGYYEGTLTLGCDNECQYLFMVGYNLCGEGPTLIKGDTPLVPLTCAPKCADTQVGDQVVRQTTYEIVNETEDGTITMRVKAVCAPILEPCANV